MVVWIDAELSAVLDEARRELERKQRMQEQRQKLLDSLEKVYSIISREHCMVEVSPRAEAAAYMPVEPTSKRWTISAVAKSCTAGCESHLRIGRKRRPRAIGAGSSAFFGSTKVNLRNAP